MQSDPTIAQSPILSKTAEAPLFFQPEIPKQDKTQLDARAQQSVESPYLTPNAQVAAAQPPQHYLPEESAIKQENMHHSPYLLNKAVGFTQQ